MGERNVEAGDALRALAGAEWDGKSPNCIVDSVRGAGSFPSDEALFTVWLAALGRCEFTFVYATAWLEFNDALGIKWGGFAERTAAMLRYARWCNEQMGPATKAEGAAGGGAAPP